MNVGRLGDDKDCCVPERDVAPGSTPQPEPTKPGGTGDPGARFIPLDGGSFLMGSMDPAAHPLDGEGPVRLLTISPFAIDAAAVSNGRFRRFVAETGHVSESERFGWSFVFHAFVPAAQNAEVGVAPTLWWRQVEGACWHSPEGPGSGIGDRLDHPAVHLSHADALAYCAWAGARLPTEAEWEFAARGGLVQKRFPWGDDLVPAGVHRCNIWQGRFPDEDTGEDGWRGTCPVDAFPPNAFGLHNTCGNTWEWCADWFDRQPAALGQFDNPRGPASGSERVIRGGSYLCHASYCFRYRVSARSAAAPTTASGHLGFRLARDA